MSREILTRFDGDLFLKKYPLSPSVSLKLWPLSICARQKRWEKRQLLRGVDAFVFSQKPSIWTTSIRVEEKGDQRFCCMMYHNFQQNSYSYFWIIFNAPISHEFSLVLGNLYTYYFCIRSCLCGKCTWRKWGFDEGGGVIALFWSDPKIELLSQKTVCFVVGPLPPSFSKK